MRPTSGAHSLFTRRNPWYPAVRTLVLVLVLLFAPAAVLHCQEATPVSQEPRVDTLFIYEYSPLAGAVATTGCMGGRIYQAIDMTYLKDPLFEEIVAHEEIHRKQYEGWLASHNGNCPQTSALFLLAWEIEAYCGVRHFREEQGWSKEVLDAEYIDRMTNQFRGQLTTELIAINYRASCP